MKIHFAIGLVLCGFASGALAQSFNAPVTETQRTQRQRPGPPISRKPVEGAIPRGFRGGNPLQMLNPRAPQRYGDSWESVSFDPLIPGKWKGIKLFEFWF